jgi:hypothetical protein
MRVSKVPVYGIIKSVLKTTPFETDFYMEFPKIKLGQYVVGQCEVMTGIVLTLEGKRHLGSGETWLIFDSFDEAKTYSNQKVLDFPEIECNIYNHLNDHVLKIDSLKNDPF